MRPEQYLSDTVRFPRKASTILFYVNNLED